MVAVVEGVHVLEFVDQSPEDVAAVVGQATTDRASEVGTLIAESRTAIAVDKEQPVLVRTQFEQPPHPYRPSPLVLP